MLAPSIVVVTRETRLQGLLKRHGTKGAAAFVLKKARVHERERQAAAMAATPQMAGRRVRAAQATQQANVSAPESVAAAAATFEAYELEDRTYQDSLDDLRKELDLGYPLTFIDRSYVPTYMFLGCPVVVVVGQDGLVANTAKYVGDTPIVAVNPDPQRIDGILLPFEVRQLRRAVQRTLEDKVKIRTVTLAEVNLNDGQRLLAFNDFFLGVNTHVSARYTLRVGERAERQSSSGMILSTGAGSTGWMSSLFNMATGIARFQGTELSGRPQIRWEDRRLFWAVREPFCSKTSTAELVAGIVEEAQELVVESLMPQNGVIFSDGVETDFLEFNSGAIARFTVARQPARLVVAY